MKTTCSVSMRTCKRTFRLLDCFARSFTLKVCLSDGVRAGPAAAGGGGDGRPRSHAVVHPGGSGETDAADRCVCVRGHSGGGRAEGPGCGRGPGGRGSLRPDPPEEERVSAAGLPAVPQRSR